MLLLSPLPRRLQEHRERTAEPEREWDGEGRHLRGCDASAEIGRVRRVSEKEGGEALQAEAAALREAWRRALQMFSVRLQQAAP